MENRIEALVLRELVLNEEYREKIFPFLKAEYFQDDLEKDIFETIHSFVDEYHKFPTFEAIRIMLSSRLGKGTEERIDYVTSLEQETREEPPLFDWLVDATEKFCKDSAFLNAVAECAVIIEKNKESRTSRIDYETGKRLIEEALTVSFDTSVGHNYFDDVKFRYDKLRLVEDKIPFDLAKFNEYTRNGLPKKILAMVMAGPGVGKSLFLCHHAAHLIKNGKNVLYISLEMAEEMIGERIDENLLMMTQEELFGLSEDEYVAKVASIRERASGNLVIQQYPTSTAHIGHFKALIRELKIKKGFFPDVVIVDYLNICASIRIKMGEAGLYGYAKAIAEELRSMAVELDVQVWSATQLNREGIKSTQISMSNTGESIGTPQTVDFFFAFSQDENTKKMGQLLARILKNRYGPSDQVFAIGIDYTHMRLYDLETEAQLNIHGTDEADELTIRKRVGKGRVPGAQQKTKLADLTSFDWTS